MKFKVVGYDMDRPEPGKDRQKLFTREGSAPDLDQAKTVGVELALGFRGGWLRSANWMARREGEKPTLVVYLSKRPPQNAQLPRGYRFKRPE